MLVAGFILTSLLAKQVLAQCDRAADCAASDPWFYQCTDGTRSDYTGCANSCCANLNAAVCADPVQSYNYDGCMDACSLAAQGRCGTTTTPSPSTTTPKTTKPSTTTSKPTASACMLNRAAAPGTGSQCSNHAAQKCRGCHNGVLQQKQPPTVNGCGRDADADLRQIQEREWPLMTPVCYEHDRCFGTCGNSYQQCNQALLAGAYKVCRLMENDHQKNCTAMKRPQSECQEEKEYFYEQCVSAKRQLVWLTKQAISDTQDMCQAFNNAQSQFCKCSTDK